MVGGKYTDILFDIIDKKAKKLLDSGMNFEDIQNTIDIDKFIQKNLENLNGISTDIISRLLKTLKRKTKLENNQTKHFLKHNSKIWGRAFSAFEAMYWISTEAYLEYGAEVEKYDSEEKEKKKFRYLALREIHGRSCQVFLEILCLMKNGFADGAYARWRSLYELSVVADFIYYHEESVAISFIEYRNKEKDNYEWAKSASCFHEKGKISFNDLLGKSQLVDTSWKKEYKLSNKIVHATPQGTFKRLGNSRDTKSPSILVGPSVYGHSTPGEHSALSFCIISHLFFSTFLNIDTLILIHILDKWVDIVRYEFLSVSNWIDEKENVTEWLKKYENENNINLHKKYY